MSDDTLHGKPWEDLDTHPPGDWAETRAREWLENEELCGYPEDSTRESRLAALLREVAEAPTDQERNCVGLGRVVERKLVLAEVRRVVEEERMRWHRVSADHASHFPAMLACDEILARLEKL